MKFILTFNNAGEPRKFVTSVERNAGEVTTNFSNAIKQAQTFDEDSPQDCKDALSVFVGGVINKKEMPDILPVDYSESELAHIKE